MSMKGMLSSRLHWLLLLDTIYNKLSSKFLGKDISSAGFLIIGCASAMARSFATTSTAWKGNIKLEMVWWCATDLKTDELKEPPLPGIQAAWAGSSPVKVPLLKLQGAIPSHMLDTNDSWNAAPSVEVVSQASPYQAWSSSYDIQRWR